MSALQPLIERVYVLTKFLLCIAAIIIIIPDLAFVDRVAQRGPGTYRTWEKKLN